jgi:peptidase C13-like protein
MQSRLRRWVGAATICLLAGNALAGAPEARRVERWQAVLAAGDDAEPVFDDATQALARRLLADGVPSADIHRLSASRAQLHDGVEPSRIPLLLRRIAGLPVLPGERCLVFLTSHGEKGAGLWLARSGAALHPDALAGALSQGCGAAPTVAIVSGCYTGAFAAGAMARPNRIIFTAARADRPSFGCAVGRTYSFFDECLLGALPRFATWQGVFGGTKGCVTRMERRLGERPSEPQAYFGAAVAAIALGL